MDAQQIADAIHDRVAHSQNADYSLWTIGITTEPNERKIAHGTPKYWHQWTADSLSIARRVETYFLNEYPTNKAGRMKGGTGGDMNANRTAYVYIF